MFKTSSTLNNISDAQEKIRMNLQLMQLLKPKADTFDISTSDDEGPQG